MVPWPELPEERSFQSPSRENTRRKLIGSPATRHHSDRFLDGSPISSPPSKSLLSSPRSDARSSATILSPNFATLSPTKQCTYLELKPVLESVPFGFGTAALRGAMPLAAPAGVGSGSPLLGSARTTVQYAAQRPAQPVRY